MSRLDLPIDHFRLLGVSPASDAQAVLRTLQQRLDRAPDQGFTMETLEARADLLRSSADLLSDPVRRSAYEADLTALIRTDQPVQPALEIPSSREVAGLLLLLEAGQPLECWDMARSCLQPPQAPALGSSREADLTLLAGLAALDAARDYRDERRFEQAARLLQEGLQLLQRMGQNPALRESMHRELEDLTPYRVLDLLSRDLSCTAERQEGMALLEQLVRRRGGLEGEGDPSFPADEFQAFFKQIRGFLTVQEQVDLFSRWADAGSSTADFLAGIALTASGFARRKPERIAAARDRLAAGGRPAVTPLLANLHLLLGEVDSAIALFEEGAAKDLRAWASRHSNDGLARICAYCRDWLSRDVLPGYRDLDADPDLDAYFSDRDVLAWVEREDRRSGRHYSSAPAAPASAAPLPLGDSSWTFSETWNTDLPFSAAAEPGEDAQPQPPKPRWRPGPLPPRLTRLASSTRVRWGIGLFGLAVLLGLSAAWWRSRQPPQTAIARVQAIPVVPSGAAPAPGATATRQPRPAPLSKPPAAIPLTIASPDERQLRGLLEAWLRAKTAVLSGAQPQGELDRLARPGPIDRLQAERRQDREAGQTQAIEVQVRSLQVMERSPGRIEVQAELTYRDSRRDAQGRVVERTPTTTLRNGYVFGRDGDTWRLAATYSGQ